MYPALNVRSDVGFNRTKAVAYASGLLPDGNKEADDKAPVPRHSKTSKVASRYVEVEEIDGGLNDSDAEAEENFNRDVLAMQQTDSKFLEASKRDLSRQNEVRD